MRLRSFTSTLALAVAAASLSLPCAAIAQQPQQAFTGRQIFEGAFFGTGPLTAARPGLQGFFIPGSSILVKSPSALRALENGVQRADPSYFREIGSQLTSGDPGIVQAAVSRTENDFKRAAAAARSTRAHDVAFSNPSQGFIIISIAVVDSTNLDIIDVCRIVVNNSLRPSTRYRGEDAIAALTVALANVAVVSSQYH